MAERVLAYAVILHWDEDYQGYWVEVPSLPGCVSQGKTKEEALKNAKEAVELYLDGLMEKGQPIPQERQEGHTVTVTVAA